MFNVTGFKGNAVPRTTVGIEHGEGWRNIKLEKTQNYFSTAFNTITNTTSH